MMQPRVFSALALGAAIAFCGSAACAAQGLRTLVNLDYANGAISTYSIAASGKATLVGSFKPGNRMARASGIAVDTNGMIYSAFNSQKGKPCSSCFAVFKADGTLVTSVQAPSLGSKQADITDLQIDAAGDVFVSDMGQEATYFFAPGSKGFGGPNMVESGTNPASVAVSEDGKQVFISGSCGFGAVLQYTANGSGGYTQGSCFSIAEIALIGGVADDQGDVFTPVDGAIGLVAIANANGQGNGFRIPGKLSSVGSVALSSDASTLYVADARNGTIFAYARPSGGWTTGTPKMTAKYTGFKHLNIIAVPI
jgi:hypothetical protein